MLFNPYNLEKGSQEYPFLFYDTLNDFTNQVISIGIPFVIKEITQFRDYLKKNSIADRNQNELMIELLMIGVFYQNYSRYLGEANFKQRRLFDYLYSKRKENERIKKQIDVIRGKMADYYLLQESGETISLNNRLEYLIVWLDNTKEFNNEVERLGDWLNFLKEKNEEGINGFWQRVDDFSNWFTEKAENRLGMYTEDWKAFNKSTKLYYQGREDAVFCSRKPNEYHLNMVAAEIINRNLRESFNKTKKKIVLLPTCMANKEGCEGEKVNGHFKCKQCSSDCGINQLTKSMNKKQVETVLIPHSTGFSKYLKPFENSRDTGLIGVACVLNLLQGGYEMQKLNIPSQCVFLNHSGCAKHWLEGSPTCLNKHQLLKIIENEPTKRTAYSYSE